LKTKALLLMLLLLSTLSCNSNSNKEKEENLQNGRVFQSSFESISDFSGFYITPKGENDSDHEFSTEKAISGSHSHKAWITSARAENNDGLIYLPHRAYPTIQLHKTTMGSFVTPCIITFHAYLDISLTDRPLGQIDDWFSFATLSPDKSDNWERTILVNIALDNLLRLVHAPDQGKQEYIYQNTTLQYPYREWVRISIYIDLSKDNGYAKVYQNGTLVSHAEVNGGNGLLEQAHFGLYSSAAIPSGTIFNEDLEIREVSNESEALQYVY
jgi:hypothetical protein